MIRVSFKAVAALALAAALAPSAYAQSCSPTCAAPQGPIYPVPPVPGCEPTCAAPSECSTGGNNCNTCYQPQQINAAPQHRGLFGCRPLFNWTKIEVESREKCCQPQAQCCQTTAQPTMAMPMMTMQPVQLQMTAYQPVMMAAPQYVQAAPQMMAAPQMVAAPQFVQAAPQMVAAPQFVQAAPQMVAAPQMAYARPQVAEPQGSDDCRTVEDACRKIRELKDRVDELAKKMESGSNPDLAQKIAQHEEAIKRLETASNLQTEILQDMKKFFSEKYPENK